MIDVRSSRVLLGTTNRGNHFYDMTYNALSATLACQRCENACMCQCHKIAKRKKRDKNIYTAVRFL